MPYIKPERRGAIADFDLSGKDGCYDKEAVTRHAGITTPGELNFAITDLLNSYLKEKSYTNFNEIIGVLECVKQEYYRRMVAPYEDKKKEENGDVYN